MRVPILYGPVEYLGEGAVDSILASLLKAKSAGIVAPVDTAQLRYPTHVDDVADAVTLLLESTEQVPFFSSRPLLGPVSEASCPNCSSTVAPTSAGCTSGQAKRR